VRRVCTFLGTRTARGVLPLPVMRASSASAFSIEVEFDVERPRRVAWPLMLCGFLALLAAGAAVTEGPLGRTTTVRPYADAARGGAIAAWGEVVGLTRR
jgi:hypothetical protein